MNVEAIKMGHVVFDTLKFVEKLESAGIPAPQAKAILEAQRAAFEESLDNTLATKADITSVKMEINEVKTGVAEVKVELKMIKWVLGFLVLCMVSMMIKTFF